MNEIKCPHCHTLFTINESEYSQLLEQVRGQAFDEELQKRLINEIALLEEKRSINCMRLSQKRNSYYQLDKPIRAN